MVVELRWDEEKVCIDQENLHRLKVSLGSEVADNILMREVEELVANLRHVETCYIEGLVREIEPFAKSILVASENVGWITLAHAAENLMRVCTKVDDAALSACVDRLSRVGKKTLLNMWDLREANLYN